MSRMRMCGAWKASLHHRYISRLFSSPAVLFSLSPARLSQRSFSACSTTATVRKCGLGQVSWAEEGLFPARKLTSAFYSDSLPVKQEESKVLVDVMEFGNKESLLKEVEAGLGSSLGTGPQAPTPKPLVLVISGPSGVGKDAVINGLKEVRDEIHFVVTATTRPKRPNEVDGKDYFFVTKEEFEAMIERNELLEHALVYGDYKGIPKRQVRDCLAKGLDVVLRVDVQGAATIRSILGSSAVFIFLVAESEAALVMRLVERKTETKEKLLLRIATAREELKRINEFDYVVVNADDQLEKTVSLVSHIIDAEKARVHQREPTL